MLRTVTATRYVVPLREGGSLPAIVEADDLGLYVVKFRGAGQGILALIAELMAGEIGRSLGLRVPELVFMNIDPTLGRNEPDYEIRQLLKASAGLNLALDYLPGSVTFDLAARDNVSAEEASLIVWLDAFTQNVDRTAKNTNLLVWHKKLYLIDHGAAFYFHHNWDTMHEKAESAFPDIRNHVLLRWASQLPQAAQQAHKRLTPKVLDEILDTIPDAWLEAVQADLSGAGLSPAERRAAYHDLLTRRLAASHIFEKEALDAHGRLI